MNIRTIATATAFVATWGTCHGTTVELLANDQNRALIHFQGSLDGRYNNQDKIHISCKACRQMPGRPGVCSTWSSKEGAITSTVNGTATKVPTTTGGFRYTLTPNSGSDRMMTFQGYIYCPMPKTDVDGAPLYNTVGTEILVNPKRGWGDIIWSGDINMTQTAPQKQWWYGTAAVTRESATTGNIRLNVADTLVIRSGETKPVIQYLSGSPGTTAVISIDTSELPDLRCWVSGGRGDWTLGVGPTDQLLCRHEMHTKKEVTGNMNITAIIR